MTTRRRYTVTLTLDVEADSIDEAEEATDAALDKVPMFPTVEVDEDGLYPDDFDETAHPEIRAARWTKITLFR